MGLKLGSTGTIILQMIAVHGRYVTVRVARESTTRAHRGRLQRFTQRYYVRLQLSSILDRSAAARECLQSNQAGRRRLGIFESRSAQEWLKVRLVLKETG
jgi:hypothetical protein